MTNEVAASAAQYQLRQYAIAFIETTCLEWRITTGKRHSVY